MAFIGGVIPTGPSGAGGSEQSVRKKRVELRKGDDLDPARRDDDTAEISAAEDAQEVEHVRGVRRNDSEESREEHTEHGVYGPDGRRPDGAPPRINLKG